MRISARVRWALLAAVGGLPLVAGGIAHAQIRVGQDGKALDANPQVGSGGYNSGYIPPDFMNMGNRTVTGNVTGGREFRGFVPYTDPREFRGPTAGLGTDRFIARSSGVPMANQPAPMPGGQAQPFYGRALAAPAPQGFEQQRIAGVYTPAPQASSRDTQYGGGPISNQIIAVPMSSNLFLPGPIDPRTNQPTVVTASPLMGVRQWDMSQLQQPGVLSQFAGARPSNFMDRLKLDPAAINAMREELVRSMGGSSSPAPQAQRPDTEPPAPGQPSAQGRNLAQPLPQPFDAPQTPTMTGAAIDASITGGPLVAQNRIDQAVGARLTNVPPAAVSTQYAELQKRLERYYTERFQTDEDRYREFLKQLRAREAAEKAQKQPDVPIVPPDLTPATPATVDFGLPDYARMSREIVDSIRGARDVGNVPVVVKPKPMQIQSLAEGVKPGPLANALKGAEDLMKQGNYLDAVDRYSLAEAIAPRNMLGTLGKAHAELGAGYYRRAAMSLRHALATDPTLMMGQYDVRAMIGVRRLETVVGDLKEAARKDESDTGSVLLLAYLAYNSGSEEQAAMYLELAQKRSEGKDEFFKLLRAHWALPGEAGGSADEFLRMNLSDLLRQFDEGNVKSATLREKELTVELRKEIEVPGQIKPVTRLRAELPSGAAGGALGQWLQQNKKGAELRIEVPATQPSQQ